MCDIIIIFVGEFRDRWKTMKSRKLQYGSVIPQIMLFIQKLFSMYGDVYTWNFQSHATNPRMELKI